MFSIPKFIPPVCIFGKSGTAVDPSAKVTLTVYVLPSSGANKKAPIPKCEEENSATTLLLLSVTVPFTSIPKPSGFSALKAIFVRTPISNSPPSGKNWISFGLVIDFNGNELLTCFLLPLSIIVTIVAESKPTFLLFIKLISIYPFLSVSPFPLIIGSSSFTTVQLTFLAMRGFPSSSL